MKKCPYCGEEIRAEATKCRYCQSNLSAFTPPPFGESPSAGSPEWQANDAFAAGPHGRSRGIAALLSIFLGYLGIHYFYMGKNTGGIVYLIISLVSCCTITSILGLIQGILMFCMTNQEFERRYITTPSSFPF